MSSLPPDELLPVLVADLADDDAVDILESAARAGSRIFVPLETAPVSASEHVLEVSVPSASEPFLFIAQPLGPPTEDGFPLRIKSMPYADSAPRGDLPAAATPGVLKSRRSSAMTLTESHTKDLSHVGPLPKEEGDALIGKALAGGKLLIEQMIGKGGVGAVYKAVHRALHMPVAVKVLHESFQRDLDFCRRFYAEALAASRLDHPNITRVIDFGQEPDGQLYFAMEFLDGVELRTVLEQERALPAERVVEIMMQVCAGLSHAHARGIVHRDIKPENLVLVPGQDDDGKPIELVKVCDFGIAQQRAMARSQQGTIAGTPEYMSPEQCRGDELDARSDVYACGVVLYELATGQVPFMAERPQSLLNKHQFTPPLPLSKIKPDVDPLLEKIALKALAKEPEDRQQSMRDLRAELRELLSPVLVEASPPPASVRDIPSEPQPMSPPRPVPPPLPRPQTVDEFAPASQRDVPAWLERGAVYAGGAPGPGPTPARQATPQSLADEMATAIAQNPSGWLQALLSTPDPRAFAQGIARVEPGLRALAIRGDVKTLWTVSSMLHGVSMEGTQGKGSRAYAAARLLRLFEDPNLLALVAQHLLVAPEETRELAKRLLINAGVAGAYGLYGGRIKLANDPQVRIPFMRALKEFGPKAWPVVRAALEKLLASEDNPRAMDLAEDLLFCVPTVGDESAGHVVVKYLRVNHAAVCGAATASIVKLWADRAKPLLMGMVQSKDDVVRIAGIAGVRQLNAVDERVVPRLHAILTRRVPASEEVRAAAALALAQASDGARQPALTLLAQLVTPNRDAMPESSRGQSGSLSREDTVIVAASKSLLQLGGQRYRGLVAERAERSHDPLRGQLRSLLAN